MSNWDGDNNRQQPGNVTPFQAKRPAQVPAKQNKEPEKTSKQIITPIVSIPDNHPVLINLEGIRGNNGASTHLISHLIPKDAIGIDRITTVEREDGSVGFLEVRFDVRPTGKTYRVVYLADVTGSDNPRQDGHGLNSKLSALAEQGLYTPTNARALIKAQQMVEASPGMKLAIFWCEGDKAREAVARRLHHDDAMDWSRDNNLILVTAATLGGQSGAKNTNYELRPPPGVHKQYIVEGKNSTILKLKAAKHYIVLDNDKAGRAEGVALVTRLEKDYGVSLDNIFIVEAPPTADAGWDDADPLPENVTEEDRLRQFFEASPVKNPWSKVLVAGVFPDVDKQGNPKATYANTKFALQQYGLEFRHNTFKSRYTCGKEHLEDYHARQLSDRIVEEFGFDPGEALTWRAAVTLAEKNQFHPIREYLDSLKWDGVPRLSKWMTNYMGAADTELNAAYSTLTLVAGVRRVKQPGCKFDTITVFEGLTGKGKSTALTILAGGEEYFSDSGIIRLSEKEQMEHLEGVWIQEIAELDGMSKADVNTIKTFASRKVDRGRPAYGRSVVERPRQCIFFGTTNETEYLRDTTGNRRFWPVKTGEVDYDWLERDRDQLWAEAVAIEKTGISLTLDRSLWGWSSADQQERLQRDPWLEELRELDANRLYLEGRSKYYRIPVREIYSSVLDIKSADRTQINRKRIVAVMAQLGWEAPALHGCQGRMQHCFQITVEEFNARRAADAKALAESTGTVVTRPARADDDDIPF